MAIQGMQYNKAQTEYQYFPEDYFSGADVTIYFGDVWIDDLSGLNFNLEEQLNPIFGYNSYTWDAVGRGQRIVQGSFTIPFKEAGYLHRMLAHIGQMGDSARPFISYALAGQTKPKWVPSYGENFEALLDRAAGGAANSTRLVTPQGMSIQATTSNTANWPVMQLGTKNEYVGALKREVKNYGPGAALIKPTLKRGSKGTEVTKLQKRLNEYLSLAGVANLKVDGIFGPLTESNVRRWQSSFSRTLPQTGIVDDKTAALMNQMININSATFDAPTKYAVMKYQKAMKLTVDGIVGPKTKAKLTRTVNVVKPGTANGVEAPQPIQVTHTNSKAERAFSQYESTVWGNAIDDTVKSAGTHFYGTESQSSLLSTGFDIYINYGPLGAAIAAGTKKTVNFNTSIRTIRNVQISAVGQILSPTGEPIAEQYAFIARDLD